MDDQLRREFAFSLTDSRQVDENIWLKTYAHSAGGGNVLSTFDIMRLDKLCQESRHSDQHIQWAIFLTRNNTNEGLTLVLISTPLHLDREAVNVRTLLDLHVDNSDKGRSIQTASSSNHLAMSLSESLLAQCLHFKVDIEEQIVDEQRGEVFVFATIHFTPTREEFVVIDGHWWTMELNRCMEEKGLDIAMAEVSHGGKDWCMLNCFLLLRAKRMRKENYNDTSSKESDEKKKDCAYKSEIVNQIPKSDKTETEKRNWSSVINGTLRKQWTTWVACTLLGMLVSSLQLSDFI